MEPTTKTISRSLRDTNRIPIRGKTITPFTTIEFPVEKTRKRGKLNLVKTPNTQDLSLVIHQHFFPIRTHGFIDPIIIGISQHLHDTRPATENFTISEFHGRLP